MKTLAIVAAVASFMTHQAASAGPLDRTERSRAVDALELHYLDRGIYSPVRCAAEEGPVEAPQTWIFCHSIGGSGDIGGLYLADILEGSGLTIWAINGKAIQHIGGGDPVVIEYMRGNQIAVDRWRGDVFDIPAILEMF